MSKVEFKGIDVSVWQGVIDWRKVKAAGIEFAMIRAGYGKGSNRQKQTDKYFHSNVKNAQAAGIKCGAYHYSYAKSVDDAKKEAAFFLDIINGYKLEYPVAFDIEDESQASLGREALTDIVIAFCDTVEKAGYYTMFYTSLDWAKNRLNMSRLSRFDFWLAQWAPAPTYNGKFGMWQRSSTGTVDGISGHVDLNVAYKDYAAIIKKVGLNGFSKGSLELPVETETEIETETETPVLDWKEEGLLKLEEKGIIIDPAYWENKMDETITVGEVLGILGKMVTID